MDIPRRKSLRFGAASKTALVAAVVIAALFATWRSPASVAAPPIDRASIWTDRVRRGDLIRQVPVHGTLIPEHVEWLSATSAGQVARIAVRPGAEVEPDTVVVVLSNAELELAALEAERAVASARSALIQLDVRTKVDAQAAATSLSTLRAELRAAERHAGTAEELFPKGLISGVEREDARSRAEGLAERARSEDGRLGALAAGRERQLAALRGELERLQEIALFARRRLAALDVRAGIRGVVQDIPLESGQWVAVGTVLAKVAEPGRLKAEVRVSEAEAKDVHRGLPVRFDDDAGGAFRGHVARVDPVVVRGAVRLEVAIDDALPPGARADQTISGRVEIETIRGVLLVARPAGALDGSSALVFRLDPDRTHASRVGVRLGRGSAREIELLGGLEEGDEIAISDVAAPEGATRIRLIAR